jgi:hopanoid biosynthesis associated protein HpnK
VPRLIINADDLGLTSGVNRAVEEVGRTGAITSATMMANARAFEQAVALAKRVPRLRIGCHIVLVDGEPVTSGIPSLTDGTATFKRSLRNFALAALREQLSQAEIQREAAAQIGKIQSAGISLTHVDTHKHTHIFPHVLRPVLKAAKACGIRGVRNPFEPIGAWPSALLEWPALWVRTFEAGLLSWFAHRFREIVAEEGMSTTGGTVGIIATGRMNQRLLLRTIHALPEGNWELVCHPGYADSDLRAAGTRLLEAREIELETLGSEETREALTRRGIELISYGELS